jgi:hypothetical protein
MQTKHNSMSRQTTRRGFLQGSLAAGAALALPCPLRAAAANEEINVGVIGCGGRGGEVSGLFSQIDGVNIAGLCDPDQQRVADFKKRFPKAQTWTDLRGLLDDKSIDAVIVTTCNHWHALAAIWAMQAGKDVYVEKPLANTHWEGEQIVAAASKYQRMCQVGTQQRSDPMQAEIKRFLHNDQKLGKLHSVRVNRYGVREPIGKRSMPLQIPKTVDYNLWLGPAADDPIYRDKFHYDWHWVWNTGCGEMGNWGVHVLDDVRNNVFLDKASMPTTIHGAGGRVAWNDAGETPNLQFAHFDAGGVPVIMALCNIGRAPGSTNAPKRPGPGSGYIAYCEGGRLEGQRGKAVAYDKEGKVIQQFSGNSGNQLHQQNFIDAVRSRDPKKLNARPEIGLHSTGWCHLANVAFLAGEATPADELASFKSDSPACRELAEEFARILADNKIADGELRVSRPLHFDAQSERFTGEHAAGANKYLTRQFRAPFVVPDLSAVPERQAAG